MQLNQTRKNWLFAAAVVLIVFLPVQLFLYPLYNSGDDVHLLYRAGGGYGTAPTNLLHYNHIWHPALGWVVQSLFTFIPGINWYTVLLVCFHAAASMVIFFLLLRWFHRHTALLFFGLFFLFVELRNLLSLNFTAASWLLAAAALLLLLDGCSKNSSQGNWLLVTALLLLSALLRLHVLAAVLALMLPAFFLYAWKKRKTWMFFFGGLLLASFLLNLLHVHFYQKQIPGWSRQENIRQALFYSFNRPQRKTISWQEVFHDSTERLLYANRMFYDSAVFTPQRLLQISKKQTRIRDFSMREDREVFYWLWIEMRVYLLLLAILFFICLRRQDLSVFLKRFLIPALPVAGMYVFLNVFLKITLPVHTGLLLLLFLFFVLALPGRGKGVSCFRTDALAILLLSMPVLWMGYRNWKNDRENREKHIRFACMIAELAGNRDKLFVATDNFLPFDFFYIWHTPSQFQVTNLIHSNKMDTREYRATLQRYHIDNLDTAIYKDPRVLLVGNGMNELPDLYRLHFKTAVQLSDTLPGYGCLHVKKAFLPPLPE